MGPPQKLPLERHVRHALHLSIIVPHEIEVAVRAGFGYLVLGLAVLPHEIQDIEDKVVRESSLTRQIFSWTAHGTPVS